MRRSGHLKRKDAGFSLVEIILSIAILAIISIPLLMYFSDSVKHSAMMGTKQKATLLAQQVKENIETDDEFLQRMLEVTGAVAPAPSATPFPDKYTALDGTEYEVTKVQDFDLSGRGKAKLKATIGNYDVVINADSSAGITYNKDTNTDLSGSSVDNKRYDVKGIDNTCEVLVVEGTELEDAITYFMAVNNAYVYENADQPVPPLAMSEADIKANMTRDIYVETSKNADKYHVKVYYKYICKDIKGAGTSEEWISSDLVDEDMKQLKKIYLFYNRKDGNKDTLCIDNVHVTESGFGASPVNPVIVLVCQNRVKDADANYKVIMHGTQNVESNLKEIKAGVVVKDTEGGLPVADKKIVGRKSVARRTLVEIKVYKKGDGAAETAKPYISMSTTKGE